ncbi:MAG: hypothetical protein ABIH92_03880 [Nanoarchaeota archaeon]
MVMKKRGQLPWQYLVPIIIVLGFIVLMLFINKDFRNRLWGMGDFLKNLIRFGR